MFNNVSRVIFSPDVESEKKSKGNFSPKLFLLRKTMHVWTTLQEKSCENSAKVHKNLWETQLSFFFGKQFLFMKMFLGTRRMKFWQTFRKFNAQNPKIFCLISENANIANFLKAFFWENLLWTRRVQFWRSCWKTFAKNPEKFDLVSKNELVFLQRIFPSW